MSSLIEQERFVSKALEAISPKEWDAMLLSERDVVLVQAIDAWNVYANVRGYDRWLDEKGTWHIGRLTPAERGWLRAHS